MNRKNNKENKKRFDKNTQPARPSGKRKTDKPAPGLKKNVRSSRLSDKSETKETSSEFKKFNRKDPDTKRPLHKRTTDKPISDSKRNFEKKNRPLRASDKRGTKEISAEYKKFSRKNSQPARSSDKKTTNKPSTNLKEGDEKGIKPSWSPRKKPIKKSSISLTKVEENETRLNKYLASTGLCSRREADELIKSGLITVNDELVTELGLKVKRGDDIRYNGERLKTERLVYVLLNKPKDYVTTVRDGHAARTVMDLVGRACKERIYPVGRLDKNTTGVLLFTNDGDLAKKLSHPSYNKLKIYHVTLDKGLTRNDFNQIIEGLTLDDGPVKIDALNYADSKSTKEVGIELHSGRNRIVRRIFEHFGYNVRKLDRVYFAGLTKKGLERGKYRLLNETEIAMLKMGSYK